MARLMNKLTARQVETIREPGRHGDGGGLYLVVTPSGTRNWSFVYTRRGKRREMGIGPAGRTGYSLIQARERAQECRDLLRDGLDPLNVRQRKQMEATDIPTFGDYADTYIAAKQSEWRNEKHHAQWRMTLTDYCRSIRNRSVADIDTADILEVLRPIWSTKSETASRLRGRIENVLDAAKAEGLRTGENPARWRGHLDKLLPKRQRLARGHHAAMPYASISGFMVELQEMQSTAALALRFLILTAARTGEVREATWNEIDFEKAVWIVPGHRMKAGRPHRVPLSEMAVSLLEDIGRFSKKAGNRLETDTYVFPGRLDGRPLSNMAMGMLMRRLRHENYTVHGFRSAFRDWVGEETDYPRETAEAALAHVIGDQTERAYRRRDALEKRRELMEAWADYCGRPGAIIEGVEDP